MNTEMQNKVLNIYSNLNNIFRSEEDQEPIMKVELKDVDENFFIAQIIAMKLQMDNLTGNKMDLLEFTHVVNQLIVQYLLDNKEKEGQ